MKYFTVLFLLAMNVFAGQAFTSNQIIQLFNEASADKVPLLQTTACKTLNSKAIANKSIYECHTVLENSLLTVDALDGKAESIWLMLDADKLPHPTDIWRSAGILVRVARGGEAFGNYLQAGTDALRGMQQNQSKQHCVIDQESNAELCMQSDDGRIYNIILTFSKK